MAGTTEMTKDAKGGAATLPPLKLSRLVHAPPQTVFKAWTAAEHLARWFAPLPFTVPDCTIEARAGGRFELHMAGPEGMGNWMRGQFIEVTPITRIVFETEQASESGQALFWARTELTFAAALGGTQIDVIQIYRPHDPIAATMIGGAEMGWGMTLDQLEKHALGMQGAMETGVRSVVHATFHLERVYDAPASRVWKALTDPAAKQAWFNGPYEVLERSMDVRPGGRERLQGRWEGGLISTFDAVYHDVIAPERLVYSYEMHQDDKKISVSLATMQLRAEGSKTRLMVTEQGAFLDGYDDAGSREHGTGILLEMLGASLKD